MTGRRPGIASPFLPPPEADLRRRLAWAPGRREMEALHLRRTSRDGKDPKDCQPKRAGLAILRGFLKAVGLYARGRRNAQDLALTEVDLHFADLPPAFDGFTILHISDLHVDCMPGLERIVLDTWDGRPVDLCVWTGDLQDRVTAPPEQVLAQLAPIAEGIPSRLGVLCVLGNHDPQAMVARLEALGVRVLVNESVSLRRGDDEIRIVGLDDVHGYYTPAADAALAAVGPGFSIALVHSAEAYDLAAGAGVRLYLCGHTHAGQICLPGGRALVRELRRGRNFYHGPWRYEGMVGRTHPGTGTSGVPVRFNSRGELAVIRLRRGV
jgi:hypothetical protein